MIKAVIFDYDWVLVRYYFLPQPKLFKLAEQLRAKGIKTAVLSNRINPLTWLARRGGQLKDFDPVFFYSDIGYSKPDPEAYNAVLEELRLTSDQCLFVDNRSHNITAARQLGIKTIEAQNTDQTVGDIRKTLGI